MQKRLTKAEIVEKAQALGSELVGFAPVGRWEEFGEVPTEFHPRNIWPLVQTVIVMAVPVWLPIVEAAPSELGREHYLTTNELLDVMAYRLAAFLNHHGHAAINLPRDGYGEAGVLAEKQVALFSHVWAGYYAGLGQVGWNHTLLSKEYGPRQRLVSVFTTLKLEGDPMIAVDLCSKCLLCQKICPSHAFSGDHSMKYARMDKLACMSQAKKFRAAFRNPCGFCIKVCPVGEDRKLFQSTNLKKYFDEAAVLAKDPAAEEYRSWLHIRKYGGYPLPEDPKKE
ncbi:MAG TPA: epoxyqueuosine reductase [Firmicutes bacterium]|nr:epoxyqueuosine reductase [Bacillota bacterium]